MFKNMKPLPKALLIAIIVGAPIAAYVKFAPSKPAAPVVSPIAPVAVPAEAASPVASVQAEAPVAPAVPAAPAPVSQPSGLTPASGQDAGIAAVLKAGKK